jgi:hypothetical protein
MSEHDDTQHETQDDGKAPEPRNAVSKNRIIIWVLVGGFGLYLIGSGVVGMLTQ